MDPDTDEAVDEKRHICRFCGKQYKLYKNLHLHIRNVHGIEEPRKSDNFRNMKCPDSKCQATFFNRDRLRNHVQDVHNVAIKVEQRKFATFEDFKKWKEIMENGINCSYVMTQAPKISASKDRVHYYTCDRSGFFYSKGTGKRLTSLDSKKINGCCPSSMIVTVKKNKVRIVFWKSHFGHKFEVGQQSLSREEKSRIGSTVEEGASCKLEFDDDPDGNLEKDNFLYHVLARKDIQRVKKSLAAERQSSDSTDVESLDQWVKSCFQMENSPVLLYKTERASDGERNSSDCFALIIMTEYQKHILVASAKKILCVDRIHRRRTYHYYTTIIYVMDECNLAFPVAFCISSKVDKFTMFQFFDAIKQTTGPLETNYFMSDSEDFFYDAWREVMSSEPKWLWNSWFVDTFWRGKLQRTFKNEIEKRADIYNAMRSLLEFQGDEATFLFMLEEFMKSLVDDVETRNLGMYLDQHYVPYAENWSHCYRKDLSVDTNMHLEILHRTLAFCSREGFKRLDKYVFILMKLVRDKILDRLSKIENTKLNLALSNIDWCHQAGLNIPVDNIMLISDNKWEVDSMSEKFQVTRCNDLCPERCSLVCEECNICVHLFMCTCYGNLINANICEHIHAVAFTSLDPKFSPPPSPANAENSVMSDNEESMDDETTPSADDDCRNIEDVKADEYFYKALKQTHNLYQKIKSNKCNLKTLELRKIIRSLHECLDVFDARQSPVESDDENPEFDDFIVDSVPINTVSKINSVAGTSIQKFSSIKPDQFFKVSAKKSLLSGMNPLRQINAPTSKVEKTKPWQKNKIKLKEKLSKLKLKRTSSKNANMTCTNTLNINSPTIHAFENMQQMVPFSPLTKANSGLKIDTSAFNASSIRNVSNLRLPINLLTAITGAGSSSFVNTSSNVKLLDATSASTSLKTVFALTSPINSLTNVKATGGAITQLATSGNKSANTVFAILTPLSTAQNVKTFTSTGTPVSTSTVSADENSITTSKTIVKQFLSKTSSPSKYVPIHNDVQTSNQMKTSPQRSSSGRLIATARKSVCNFKLKNI